MKKYIDIIINFALYGGLTEEEYRDIIPLKRNENRKRLKTFSFIGVIGFAGVFLLNLVSSGFNGFATVNSRLYGITAIAMLFIYLFTIYVTPRHPEIITLLTYFFIATLNFFAISVAMLHPDLPAVSIFVFLIAVPLLFVDRPIRMTNILIIIGVVFCIISKTGKAPDIAAVDIWNMVTFGFVTIVVNLFMMRFKIKALYESKMVVYLSETDVLTGLKNRNQFEKMLQNYAYAFDKTFQDNNYHVSFGVVETVDKDVVVEKLVKDAEKEMYDAKRRYYEESGLVRDRRRNRR